MKTLVAGKWIDLPETEEVLEGEVVDTRDLVPSNRVLIEQNPDGINRIVPKQRNFVMKPNSQYIDAPSHRRG